VTRAREFGWTVAALAIARGEADGHANSGFSSAGMQGRGTGSPRPPAMRHRLAAPWGTWRPWLMNTPDELQHVLGGPSPYGSAAFMAQLQTVLSISSNLTEKQKQIVYFWEEGPGTFTPAGHDFEIATGPVKTCRMSDRSRPAEALRVARGHRG
jgi:hypothetical protein